MNPKTPEELIEEFCTLNNLDKTTVKDVLEFYFKEVKDTLVNLEHPEILVVNLGTFSVNKNKLIKRIKRVEFLINATPPNSYSNTAKHYKLSKELESLSAMYKKILEEENRKKLYKLKKWESRLNSQESLEDFGTSSLEKEK